VQRKLVLLYVSFFTEKAPGYEGEVCDQTGLTSNQQRRRRMRKDIAIERFHTRVRLDYDPLQSWQLTSRMAAC
jgi:hypothetical protein